jgi:DNA-binding Lrp family transcriptional regulator
MSDQMALRPLDVAVALRLAEIPGATYQALAADLAISSATAHEAVSRLSDAGLVRRAERHVNRRALLEFLEHGVRYAFPGKLGTPVRGVPTAHSGPVLAKELEALEPVVWPEPTGTAVGPAVSPLLDKASRLPTSCPSVYEMLTLVDAIRVGRARERTLATEHLRRRLRAA